MPKESARAKLRAAAFALFAEQGFDATTIDQIAARAGVGRTTFFRTFGSKEDVVFPEHDQLTASIEARLAASTPESSLIAITDAARLVLLYYLDEGDLARARYELTRSVPALRARELFSAQQYQGVFQRFVLRWLGDQPGAELHADLMAACVVAAHNYVLRRWLRGLSPDPLAEFDAAMSAVAAVHRRQSVSEEATVVVLRGTTDVDALLPRLRAALKDPAPAPASDPATPTAPAPDTQPAPR